MKRDTFDIYKTHQGPGLHLMAANTLAGENIVNHNEGELGDNMKTIPKNETLPVYEVEFILAERRISDRCSSLQRFNKVLSSGERRTSLGRREEDWEAYSSGPFPRRLSDLKKQSKVRKSVKPRSTHSQNSVGKRQIWPFFWSIVILLRGASASKRVWNLPKILNSHAALPLR